MKSYKIFFRENAEEKNYGLLYLGIDFSIFLILLLLVGNWIVALIVSTIIGIVLDSANPMSKNNTKMFKYSLEFEKDQFLFKTKEKRKMDFHVPYESVTAIESEMGSYRILMKRKNDSNILFSVLSDEIFIELVEKLRKCDKLK